MHGEKLSLKINMTKILTDRVRKIFSNFCRLANWMSRNKRPVSQKSWLELSKNVLTALTGDAEICNFRIR